MQRKEYPAKKDRRDIGSVDFAIEKIRQILLLICLVSLAVFNTAHADCNDKRAPGMDWSGCKKTNKMLDDTNFSGSRFDDASLASSSLDDSNFNGASLVKTDLTRASATGTEFYRADLTKAVGYRANFDNAKLESSTLTKSEFHRASFREARLVDVDWSRSELARVDFTGARLKDVSFEFSNIARARFGNASLSNVNLKGAYTYLTHFEGLDLRGVVNLEQSQINLACGDLDTRLPKGRWIPDTWPCSDWLD